MKNLMIATAIAAAAIAGTASAESTVRQQNDKLKKIWAEQRAGAEVKQASRTDEGNFFTRTFGGFGNVEFKAISPAGAEAGGRSDFRAPGRDR